MFPNARDVELAGHQIAELRDPQYKDALPQEGLAYGCSAIRPSPWSLDSLGCPLAQASKQPARVQF